MKLYSHTNYKFKRLELKINHKKLYQIVAHSFNIGSCKTERICSKFHIFLQWERAVTFIYTFDHSKIPY